MNTTIRYIKQSALDLGKWRECIDQSTGSLLYADPDWLCAMAGHWDGLIVGDYEAVMPVYWRKKWGVRYLYQPAFIQKTGIYAKQSIIRPEASSLLAYCRKQFSFAEFFVDFLPEASFSVQRNNFVVALDKTVPEIRSDYSKDLERNLRIAAKYDLQYKKGDDPATVIQIFRTAYGASLSYTADDYANLLKFCTNPKGAISIEIREVQLKGVIQAACLCVKDKRCLYLLMNVTTAEGRKSAANHFLLDRLIEEFCGKLELLDLEGSDKEGIAHFYQNFGAVNEPYYFVAWNHLPGPIRYLKPVY